MLDPTSGTYYDSSKAYLAHQRSLENEHSRDARQQETEALQIRKTLESLRKFLSEPVVDDFLLLHRSQQYEVIKRAAALLSKNTAPSELSAQLGDLVLGLKRFNKLPDNAAAEAQSAPAAASDLELEREIAQVFRPVDIERLEGLSVSEEPEGPEQDNKPPVH